MTARTPRGSVLLLDTCCIINLFATGRAEAILGSDLYEFATSRLILEKEIIAVAGGPGSGEHEREVIPPTRLGRLLRALELETDDEFASFVQFASDLDDGEASVCSLALVRGAGVATDDRKALRLLERQYPQIPTIQTPEILYQWTMAASIPDAEVGDILRAVQQSARFLPRRGVPCFDWWDQAASK